MKRRIICGLMHANAVMVRDKTALRIGKHGGNLRRETIAGSRHARSAKWSGGPGSSMVQEQGENGAGSNTGAKRM